ncbi:MAG: mannitol dehydrogenase family protein [Anaerovorax sp.]|nr:mannitol dehydrogenase family protein [Anaerovorax sp.]
MKLTRKGIQCAEEWNRAGIGLPQYDIDTINKNTIENPRWIHFGAGNIFRGFLAAVQQKLLNKGCTDYGIIAVESFDYQIIDKVYVPYDNLSLLVLMAHDGTMQKDVISSVSESLKADSTNTKQWERLQEIFQSSTLQMVSFTITEKGYALKQMNGEWQPVVDADMKNGPATPKHTISIITSLLYKRYQSGKYPLAVVSMDNCARNGEKLCNSIITIATNWRDQGYVEDDFLDYLKNDSSITFPWTMIDKITPHPSVDIQQMLLEQNLEDMNIVETNTGTLTAPYVNSEVKEYLVVEDCFPNGRPCLEKAGVIFTDRVTVDLTEKMKVGTCLNPLHTALAIFGCLLGYQSIAEEIKNKDLLGLVNKIAFDEGMPVVADPGIIDPKAFVKEVIEQRFTNLYIPDTPQRIAADTSQKIPVRYGKTLESYLQRNDSSIQTLTYIPLVFAAWCRYLIGIDDEGNPMKLSPDPQLLQLQKCLEGLSLGNLENYEKKLRPILKNKDIFGVDLYEVKLANRIACMFYTMLIEKGGVRKTLTSYLHEERESCI